MPEEFHFQKALKSDIIQIVEFEKMCFGNEGFSKKQIDYLIRKAKSEVILIKFSEKIVGNLILLFRKNSQHIRIYSLAVSPEFRGKGLAKKMIFYTEQKVFELNLKFISLEVNVNNTGAIQLYKSLGFQVSEEKKEYYKDGNSALVMKKKMNNITLCSRRFKFLDKDSLSSQRFQ